MKCHLFRDPESRSSCERESVSRGFFFWKDFSFSPGSQGLFHPPEKNDYFPKLPLHNEGERVFACDWLAIQGGLSFRPTLFVFPVAVQQLRCETHVLSGGGRNTRQMRHASAGSIAIFSYFHLCSEASSRALSAKPHPAVTSLP